MKDLENIPALMTEIGKRARAASADLAVATSEAKQAALDAAADAVWSRRAAIIEANAKDLEFGRDKGLSDAMMDRLLLNEERIKAICDGLRAVAAQDDPVGEVLAEWDMDSGLHIRRVRTPLGVIGVIYESRPNVTADAGALCLKSGNAVILRGGSESYHSAHAILGALHAGLMAAGVPETAIQMIPTTDRAAVGEMLRLSEHIDVIVPRGGKSLVQRVSEESRIPLFKHLEGICHVHVDAAADAEKAVRVVHNAKLRRTGICGAAETLLVDRSRAGDLLPAILDDLIGAGCAIRGCPETQAADSRVEPASEADWDTEYLDAILSVKVVGGLEEAITHIRRHSSQHTESIITEDDGAATRFLQAVDSAIVMHNASTQFADGGEFGMGAEIGISTGRMHARGPVGVEQLTIYKYVVRGDGTVRP